MIRTTSRFELRFLVMTGQVVRLDSSCVQQTNNRSTPHGFAVQFGKWKLPIVVPQKKL
jgi:hypothetical protein